MKKIYSIGLLSILLIFFQCKNKKEEHQISPSKELTKEVKKEVDSNKISPSIKGVEGIKEIELTSSKTTTETKIKNVIDIKKKTIVEVKEPAPTSQVTQQIIPIKKEAKKEVIPIKEVVQSVKEKTEATQINIEKTVNVEPTKNKISISNWVVPANYKTMKNPTNPKIDLSIGKSLYTKHCKSCHGAEGYGDGPKGEDLDGDLGDFSSAEFQAQTDGSLFYKTTIGRDDMPKFTKKLPNDEDRWLIINYLRTLAE